MDQVMSWVFGWTRWDQSASRPADESVPTTRRFPRLQFQRQVDEIAGHRIERDQPLSTGAKGAVSAPLALTLARTPESFTIPVPQSSAAAASRPSLRA
jgi:hypothetical protein